MDYRKEIDGLRAVAVVPVILFHAGFETFSGGFVGVDVFFVISGYLITTIILAELEQGKFSLVKFYERRARRILPALFVVMLVCIPFAWFWLLPSDMKDFSQSLVAVSLFLSNILFWRESGYFDTAAELKPLLHTWSLAVEEQYYVMFPLFLLLFWQFGKRFILVTLGLAFVASLALAQWAAYANPAAAFYLLPTRGWELLIGVFAAFYLYQAKHKNIRNITSEVGGWLGVALILYAVFSYSKATPFPGLYALLPTLGAALVILFATHQTTAGRFIGSKALVGIGLISYSSYLWHQPLFAFARHISLQGNSDIVFFILSTLSLILAHFSWRYIETPFRNQEKVTKKALLPMVFIFISLFTSTGIIGYLYNGNLWRYPADVVRYFELKNASDDYVWALKNKLRGLDFDSDKIKVLVIGDSNSGDLINVLHTSDKEKIFSFSSLTIGTGCGNLYLNRLSFASRIESVRARTCSMADDLMLNKNKNLILQADWVVFASDWTDWESDLLEASYTNLVKDFGKKFWFFGTKRLDFSPIDSIRTNGNASFPSRSSKEGKKSEINHKIKAIIKDRFINPYDLFCDDHDCLMATLYGDLLLYDGFHFSKKGIDFFSIKLEPFITRLAKKP